MSRIALDEGVPEDLAEHLPGHEVKSTRQLGLKGTVNGKLLAEIEKRAFEVFISNDKKFRADQNLSTRPFAILLLSTNHWPTIKRMSTRSCEPWKGCSAARSSISIAESSSLGDLEHWRYKGFFLAVKWQPGAT